MREEELTIQPRTADQKKEDLDGYKKLLISDICNDSNMDAEEIEARFKHIEGIGGDPVEVLIAVGEESPFKAVSKMISIYKKYGQDDLIKELTMKLAEGTPRYGLDNAITYRDELGNEFTSELLKNLCEKSPKEVIKYFKEFIKVTLDDSDLVINFIKTNKDVILGGKWYKDYIIECLEEDNSAILNDLEVKKILGLD